ncbi:MoxR family ATPase [Parafrankia sp. EUN1f]|uniref:AAA family ATPase n=1 Tax=Parafrankia sp. EUN1f TaxID=102897 RepID=UPI0001C455B2|nr:MoxR family ATPase [Parafrankia sp. EUN1f]EFC84663.1 ATPase associated with various cellular activities AAA_3 [Parafrankia sp. EUN1f]
MRAGDFVTAFDRIVDNIDQVVQGKPDQVELAVTCMLAGGHLLIEDLPGVGKTLLARCLAASVDAEMKRIQCTPDLLPSDITGTDVYLPGTGGQEFRPGPVFANVVLADEINRATPRAQSALLEAMEERRVTVGGMTRPLPDVFLVVATQNPVDMDGTYPLPEAQLDRFLMRIRMGYPDFDAEKRVLAAKVDGGSSSATDVPVSEGLGRGTRGGKKQDPRPVPAVTTAAQVLGLIELARRTRVSDAVYAYLLQVTRMTRALVARPAAQLARSSVGAGQGQRGRRDGTPGRDAVAPPPALTGCLALGASPRASVGLLYAAQVLARRSGRDHVWPDDVKRLAVPVLSHRLSLSSAAVLAGHRAEDIVETVLAAVAVPRG